jgi:Tfp pilus assembly protein PilZ
MRAPGRDDSVVARVQNLSARGMFVTATDLPEAGTEVQCRLTLGGERRTLRGRVAWVRPASPSAPLKSPGAGIEFIELDKRDSELLTRLVEPIEERREPVDVWFEGMNAPIRCMAIVAGDGLRLETKLPFMRLRSELRVSFPQHTPAETREGILEGVSLEPNPEDGVPFLRVAVTVPPLDSARGIIQSAGPSTLPNDPGVDPGRSFGGPARAGGAGAAGCGR